MPDPQACRPSRSLSASLLLLAAAALVATSCGPAPHDRVGVMQGDCITCHRPEYLLASSPVHKDVMPTTCNLCHANDSWTPAKNFDHPKSFPLEGKHKAQACKACHTKGYAKGDTATTCVGCHKRDYDGAKAPVHTGYPTDCKSCHTPAGWKPSTFAHKWPLHNSHAAAPCSACHTGAPARYAGTPSQCVDCHRKDYDRAIQPPHKGFPTECQQCHDDTTWQKGGAFVHKWPLIGKHATATCFSCHTGTPVVFAGTKTACVDCHAAARKTAVSPPHDSLPTDCSGCHTPVGWQPATFVHKTWALTGAHAKALCTGCHKGSPTVYAGTPKRCADCHAAGKTPSHVGFSSDCSTCHTTAAFQPANFNHSAWALTGAHALAVCGSCHKGMPPVFPGTPTQCNACHSADYTAAAVSYPSHASYPTTCDSCHDTTAFKGATFSHPGWPLTGKHAMTVCTQCHIGMPPVYAGTSKLCSDCHVPGTMPPHQGLSTDCSSCHTTTAFQPSTFAHSTWALTGTHTTTPCASCHTGMPAVYAGTPKLCYDCHSANYTSSPYPGHSTFPTTCEACHTTTAWKPASGAHSETAFPITSGSHKGIACLDCHNLSLGAMGKGNTDCVGCHTGEHTRAKMDSKHNGVSNYPTGAAAPNFCLSCHSDGRNHF